MMKHFTLLFVCLGLAIGLYGQGDCEITNVSVFWHSCEDGTFLVDIDFDIDNPEGEVFGIVGNATNYGFFMYEDLPVTLGPLAGDGETEWQFIIYDLGEPNCQYTYTLGTVDCCTISDVVINQIMCTGMTAFQARLNLSHSNTGNVGFEVYSVTGNLLGTFLYANLPVTVQNIPSFRIGPTHLTICDLGNSDCCTIAEFQDPDCNKTDCEIYNLTVDTTGCDNGEFSVVLDFDQMLGGANFTVTGNGNNYGTYPYAALPLTLGPFAGDSITDYEFIVTGAGIGNNCRATYELGPIACPPGCGFENVEISTLECRGNEAYSMTIDFVPIAAGSQGFSVYTQGNLLGSFSYDDVPVYIDSFPATGGFFDELELCDNADSSCCFTYEFRALLCCCCVINQVEVTPTVCDSNDQFYVDIDFYHFNEGDGGFQIGGTGGVMGPFSYDSLPVRLGPFNGDSMTYYEFLAYDVTESFCFDGGELGIIDCDCEFQSVVVAPVQCTSNGFYSLLLNFTPVEPRDDGFDVYAGDQFIGFFLYEDLPVMIPSFPNSGNQLDSITICDHDNPTCCVTTAFEGIDCFCSITNINAQTSLCDTVASTFDLYLDFDWDGTVTEFSIFLGSTLVGTVQGATLPDTLFGLATNIGTSALSICGNGHPDCCANVNIENPCQGPCEISGLSINVSDCDSISNTFSISVDFDWIGDYEEFEVFMDSVALGIVAGANLPEVFSGLTSFGGPTTFSVYAKDRPDCFSTIEIILEECRTIPCSIFDLVAIPGVCTSDTTFTLTVALAYEGFARDSIDAWVDDVFVGSFHIDSLPVYIEDVQWGGGIDTMSLIVCQTGDPACCDTAMFVSPYCGCDIVSISVNTLGYCNPDFVSFPVLVDIDWLGDVNSFTVYAGDELLAVLEAASLPDTVLSFPVPLNGMAEIRVCGDNDSTCCAVQSFIPANCDTSLCIISDITVDTFQCTGASTFSAWVDYVVEGFEGPLHFFANGMFLGEYQQFHPLLLLNIPESEDSIVLRICNASNPNCCEETTFQSMHCADTPCLISELGATVVGPDTTGSFQVILDFDYENVGAAFTVSGNGNQYGVFTYNNVPLTIPDLQCDTTTEWEFVVQDLQNIGCLEVVALGIVDCDSTTAISAEPDQAVALQIYYGKTDAYFIVPDGAKEMRLWTTDGRLVTREEDLIPGELLSLSTYIRIPGLYFVQVSSPDKVHIGKVIDFR